MYNAHFKFRESPFGVTPDPQFYYLNTANLAAWETLRGGIEERQGLIVILGEPGTGKTTLLKKALQNLGATVQTAYLSQTLIGEPSLLGAIASDLGLSFSGNTSQLLAQLQQFLVEQFQAGTAVAVLIDEAQDLNLRCLEELQLLCDLKANNRSLLQIVLAGQPELEQTLELPELRSLKNDIAARWVIEPLAAEEVGPYIDARLQTMGQRATDLFDAKAVAAIAAFSKGIPRVINLLCDHALLVAYVMSASVVNVDMVNEVAGDLLVEQPPGDPSPLTLFNPVEGTKEATMTGKMFAVTVSNLSAKKRRTNVFSPKYFRYAFGALAIMGLAAATYLHSKKFAYFDSQTSTKSTEAHAVAPPEIAPSSSPASTVSPSSESGETTLPRLIAPAPFSRAESGEAPSPSPQSAGIAAAPKAVTEKSVAESTPDKEKNFEKAQPANQEAMRQRANFVVVGRSFVRARPTANAEIVATLEPGADINVAGRSGEYFRVRALGRESITGYVHREDAFFERKH